jgi:DNA-binding NarL/FixJ family response regulator
MSKKPRKTGKPKAVEAEEDAAQQKQKEPTVEQFIKELHGESPTTDPIFGEYTKAKLKEMFQTKSAAIRFLVSKGFATKDIAKHLDIRYQMVRNVKTNQLKRGPNESWLPKEEQPK